MEGHTQRVTKEENWLTALFTKYEKDRQFVKVIRLPLGENWDEWTSEEYEEWKKQYQPESVEVDNRTNTLE